MSSIGGGCFLAPCRPVEAVTPILDHYLSRTGPDTRRVLSARNAVIGWGGFFINNEDRRSDCQPVRHGGLILAWDGRLDNRRDLEREVTDDLSLGEISQACLCDAHLVMEAFAKWGTSFVDHLLGDFALALWDSKKSVLYLARDPFGIRPLYMARNGEEIWWGSDIAFILAIARGTFTLDENYLAGYLTTTEEPGETPYREIKSIVPGCIVSASIGGLATRKFWAAEPKCTLHYSTDGEYEMHFRHLFAESLRCRLRADGPVMAELSGGVDSSSIVCMANHLIREGKTHSKSLETVTFAYDGSHTSDETRFVDAVVNATGLVNHRIVDKTILARHSISDGNFIPNPHRCFSETFLTIQAHMHAIGARVLLTGLCGDHVFMHEPSYCPLLAELLAQGKLSEMHHLAAWVCARRKKSYWETLWFGAIWPWLPMSLRKPLAPYQMQLPDWIDLAFARRTKLQERNLSRDPGPTFRNPCLEQRITLICNAISASSSQRYREHLCIEPTMPYLHLPLVQFLLEVPATQLLRVGEDRSLQRRSMRGILPDSVRLRTSKRSTDEPFLRAIRQQWTHLASLCSDPVAAKLGIVNRDRFAGALEKARFGYAKYVGILLRTLSLELWLNTDSVGKKLGL